MEKTIYKIEMRSRLNSHDKYPSERRYSSSVVLGLSVTFFSLALLSFLLASLVSKSILFDTVDINNDTDSENVTENRRLLDRVETDSNFTQINGEDFRKPAVLSISTLLMGFGLVVGGTAGIFASAKWYVDKNITWFFLGCSFSTITSSLAFLLTMLIKLKLLTRFQSDENAELSSSLVLNVLITCVISLIWSALAAKVAFRGMLSDYPDGIVHKSKDFNRKIKNNKDSIINNKDVIRVSPPDILRNHFEHFGKLPINIKGLENLPEMKRKDENLPKEESNSEYAERIKKFVQNEQGQA